MTPAKTAPVKPTSVKPATVAQNLTSTNNTIPMATTVKMPAVDTSDLMQPEPITVKPPKIEPFQADLNINTTNLQQNISRRARNRATLANVESRAQEQESIHQTIDSWNTDITDNTNLLSIPPVKIPTRNDFEIPSFERQPFVTPEISIDDFSIVRENIAKNRRVQQNQEALSRATEAGDLQTANHLAHGLNTPSTDIPIIRPELDTSDLQESQFSFTPPKLEPLELPSFEPDISMGGLNIAKNTPLQIGEPISQEPQGITLEYGNRRTLPDGTVQIREGDRWINKNQPETINLNSTTYSGKVQFSTNLNGEPERKALFEDPQTGTKIGIISIEQNGTWMTQIIAKNGNNTADITIDKEVLLSETNGQVAAFICGRQITPELIDAIVSGEYTPGA